MNIYAVIILTTIILSFLLDAIADFLNIRNLKTELPEEFRDTYDSETYTKSQNYLKVKTKFGYVSTIFSLAVMLIFWFSGGFPFVNNLIIQISENNIIRGITFIGVLIVANSIISLPFSIYSTFVIEEKFGFNKTTVKTFILDILKSLGLGIVLGIPILAGILYVLEFTGEYAWLYGWLGLTIVSLIIQFIAPRWLMPIFNKFTPLEEGELRTALTEFISKVKYSLKNVFVIDGSRRSSKSNAFFTGFGKYKRIALFDTLIKNHTVNEIVAILAHEIGHYKKKHILYGMIIGFVHNGIIFYLLSIFLGNKGLFEAFYMKEFPIYAGLIFFGMLYSPIETILSVLMNILSRKNEFEADRFAAENTEGGEYLISALKKLSKDNLSNLTPHPFYVFLNYSHPTVFERIIQIREAPTYR
ncbi:MAG: M48 family metallopeptidase [Ignavibacteriae bacterium]|nr:M48 family metallopeptidase [Ignavibacteriota bacterium]